jgi:secernin
MLLAKNSDRPVDEMQLVEWLPTRPPAGALATQHLTIPDPGAISVLGSRPTWLWGLEHGVNAHRVAIGNEKTWTVDDPRSVEPALLGMDLVRLALERASTADEALDVLTGLLTDHGQGGSGEEHADEPYWSSFMIVDPSGGWIVETSARSWVAQPVGDGAAISNRLTLSDGWSRSSSDVPDGSDWDRWRDPDAPTGIADHRLAATRRCVDRGAAVGPAEAVAALRDHGTGPWGAPGDDTAAEPVPEGVRDDWSGISVCMHVRDYQATTASMVVWLPEDGDEHPRAWATVGNPCVGGYLPCLPPAEGRPAVVPDALGSSEVAMLAAQLSRSVELTGDEGFDALVRARAVLDPIEAESWDEAEALGGDVAAWSAAAGRWSSALESALRRLVEPVQDR